MHYPGVNRLLEDLNDVSDAAAEVIIVTHENLLAPLRQCICEHFGVESSGDSIQLSSRRIYLKHCRQTARGYGGRLILFHPDADVRFHFGPLLFRPASHCLFLGDREVRNSLDIVNELKQLPPVYPAVMGLETAMARFSLVCAY